MAKKRATRDAGSAKPKQLRKRLRKAKDQLQQAQTKRDRAQARVEALSIIADEIRAQLAEIEQAEAQGENPRPTSRRPPGARGSRSGCQAQVAQPSHKPSAKPKSASPAAKAGVSATPPEPEVASEAAPAAESSPAP